MTMDFTLYWFMFPVSIGVATCAMLSGIGGAALFTPIFVLLFPLLGPEYALQSTLAAISAALITQTFGFLSGFVGYSRRGLIDYRLARRMLVFSIPVAVLGALTASRIEDSLLLFCYASLVLILSIGLWQHRTVGVSETVSPDQTTTIVDSSGKTHQYAARAVRLDEQR